MKIIVGLGNPGNEYETTRHNAGFRALDYIAADAPFSETPQFHSLVAHATVGGEKTILAKPQTFMNLSGQAVAAILNYYKSDIASDLIVLHDEVDLPLGEWRKTAGSRAAGHNGVQSIADILHTQGFHRIRIGIESRTDKNQPPTDRFVLSHFSPEELALLSAQFPAIQEAVIKFVSAKNPAPR